MDIGGASFVVRLSGRGPDLLGSNRAAENRAASAAAAAGVAPEVFAFLPDLGALITRFVQGAHIPEQDLEREDVLRAVVRSVRAIHSGPPIPSSFPVFRIVEESRRIGAKRGVAAPPAFEQVHARAGDIEAGFSKHPLPDRPCHNDLLNANFLLDGDHVWIVDYEYGGMGDPSRRRPAGSSAFTRSSWHRQSGSGCLENAASMSPALAWTCSNAGGAATPRSAAIPR